MRQLLLVFVASFVLVPRGDSIASLNSRKSNFVDCKNLLEDPKVAALAERIDETVALLKAQGKLTSPVEWRRVSASFGLPALDLPASLGGQDFSVSQMAALFEYAGRYSLDLRDVVGAGHGRILARSSSPEVLEVARKVGRGEAYVAISITEEFAGSDFKAMTSASERTEGGFLLTGSKLFNARLSNATHVILLTRAPQPDRGYTFFLVPLDHPGLEVTELEAHGLHGNSFGGINFKRLFVPSNMVVSKQSNGEDAFKDHFLYWRLMMSAAGIGTGKGALDQVPDRLHTRIVRGAPISEMTHLQQPLADFTASLHFAHLGVKEAAKAIDDGNLGLANVLVPMLKAKGVTTALDAANYAMETFAAEGFSGRVDLGRRVTDLMGLRIADGTTHTMLSLVYHLLFGKKTAPAQSNVEGMPIATMAPPRRLAEPESGFAGGATPAGLAAPEIEFWPDREAILGKLQAMVDPQTSIPVFGQQGYFDVLIHEGRGGACPTVNAFNWLQILREYESPGSLLSPHAVILEAFRAIPELHEGRVSNELLVRLMDYFKREYLAELDFGFKISGAPKDLTSLRDPKPNEIQGYVFDMYTAEGTFLGRHFTTLKKKDGDTITIIEPQKTRQDFTYRLQMGTGQNRHRIELVNPQSQKYFRYLESVVTIELR